MVERLRVSLEQVRMNGNGSLAADLGHLSQDFGSGTFHNTNNFVDSSKHDSKADGDEICKDRWEQVTTMLLEVNGHLGWKHLQQSLLSLPDEIIEVFEALEAERDFLFQPSSRKGYYNAFFKKAAGFAVINSLQMIELINEQVEVSDIELKDLMNKLPVNNGLFDFKCFASILCDILVANELNKQRNSSIYSCQYWYRRMIPINPDAMPKQIWDVVILILLLYSSFQVPYSMSFEESSDGSGESPGSSSLKFAFEVLLDVIFMVDVALCFITAYYDAKGMLVRNLKTIVYRYTTTWFLPDLGGSFPFDNVISLFVDSSSGNLGAMRVLKLVRMLKLVRAVKVFHALGELGQKEGFTWLKSTIGVIRSLFVIVFVAHTVGCFYYLAFVPNSTANWMYKYEPSLEHTDIWSRYITALYWAIISITTMGYGDIIPTTHEERIFCIFVALAGAIVFSYCMGTITSLVTSVTGAEYRVSEKLQHASEYLLFREHRPTTKQQVKGFYTLSWRKSGVLFKEQEILGELPSFLRKTALIELGSKVRAHARIFHGFDDECIGYVFTCMKRVDFIEGSFIYYKGEYSAEMYLVTSGSVSLYADLKNKDTVSRSKKKNSASGVRPSRIAEPGDTFAELALFPDVLAPLRTETAVANSWVVAYSLSAADVPAIAALYPYFTSKLREFCQLRIGEDRARGRTLPTQDSLRMRGGSSSGGKVQYCKLQSTIAQMQRDLLLVKEQTVLAPACGDGGSRIMKLLVMGQEGEPGDRSEGVEHDLISISCVLSGRGELLCVEHTTAGITSSELGSLGFVVPGRSTYRVMEKDEVRRLVGKSGSKGAQLFGCSVVTVSPSDFGRTKSGLSAMMNLEERESASESQEIYLFSWLEEELETLIESLDGFRIKPRANASGAPEIIVFTGPFPDQHDGGKTGAATPSAENQPCSNCFSAFLTPKGGKSCTAVEQPNLDRDGNTDFSTKENIFGHADWLVLQIEDMKRNPDRLHRTLLTVFKMHTALVKCLVENAIHEMKGSINPSSADSKPSSANARLQVESAGDDIGGVCREMVHVLAEKFGSGTGLTENPPDGTSFLHHDVDLLAKYPNAANDESEITLAKKMESSNMSVESDKNHLSRWENLTCKLLSENASSGWQYLRKSVLGLPLDIIAIYDDLEAESGFQFPQNERKLHYNSFFRKASGSAVINPLQFAELVQEQVDISDEDMKVKIDSLPVNNGLYDFKCFISLLSDTLMGNETRAQKSKLSCKDLMHQVIPIHPDAMPKQVWDVVILLLLLYSSFQVPYSLAFDDSDQKDTGSPIFAFDVLLDVIFLIDVVLCFITAYYDARGIVVSDLGIISNKYLTSWFLPDFGGSFPFDKVVNLFLAQSGNIGAMRILKLVRLLKLLRAVRVFKVLNELGEKEGLGALKKMIGIFQTLFVLVFVAHVLGCFFMMIILDNPDKNWMFSYQPDLKFADDWTRYVTSLYWAIVTITTMGYGDIKPINGEERMYSIFVALVGALTFSYCMGTISTLISNVSGARHRISQKDMEITEYMHFREFSSDLKVKIRTYYTLSWSKSAALYRESEILDELPAFLRKETLTEIGLKAKTQAQIFQGIDDECIGFLFSCMTRVDFMENQTIYAKGDRAFDMYLVSSGTVNLQYDTGQRFKMRSKNAKPAQVAEPGDIFGEAALFPDVLAPFRLETATANSWVIAYILPAAEVPKIAARYPFIVDKLKELCQLKIADDRSKGFDNSIVEEMPLLACGVVQHCPLKSMIAQMQRDLLVIKEQAVLIPGSGEAGSRIMKLLVKSQGNEPGEGSGHDLISISCVLSGRGELLCVEHTTAGIASEGLRSLGFVVPGRSTYSVMESEEVRRLVGRQSSRGAQLFGCSVLTYSHCGETSAGTDETPAMRNSTGQGAASKVRLFSWLEEELESLVELLDALLHKTPGADPTREPAAAAPPPPCEEEGRDTAPPCDKSGRSDCMGDPGAHPALERCEPRLGCDPAPWIDSGMPPALPLPPT